MFFGVFGICFLFNCDLIESLSLPHGLAEEEFGSVDQCVGMEKPGSAMGTAARAHFGSSIPDFLPAWWLLRPVLHFSLLFMLQCPLPAVPMSSLPYVQVLPLPAGWDAAQAPSRLVPCGWGLESQDGGPGLFRGTWQEQTVVREVVGIEDNPQSALP